jgi:UDPglucose 6-dehydrogenase
MATVHESEGAAAEPQRVAVIGAGYVGTPTAVQLAHFGHLVTLAEVDDERRELLASGRSPLIEEGLEALLASTLASGRLRIVANAGEAVASARFVFLCVATPTGADGRADLAHVDAAVAQIRDALAPGAVVVTKSTVPVGTAERVERQLARSDVGVVSNPEFLREGSAVRDAFSPDRVVVGGADPAAARAVGDLFAPTGAPVVLTDARTAELVKYASNAFLATKLSFVNSVAQLCEALGADVTDLVEGVGRDPRIGSAFLRPGPGWGGSCLPKDVVALLSIAADAGVALPVLEATVHANALQQDHVVERAARLLGELRGARVAVWGLTFKAHTGDRRDSPALAIAARLRARGADVVAYDPTVSPGDAAADLAGLEVAPSAVAAARGAGLVVVLTEWPEFARPDYDALGAGGTRPVLLDTRGVVDAAAARAAGFALAVLGRP